MGTQVPEHTKEGAPKGNQNARRHGWTSTKHPAPIAAIIDAANIAAERQDLPTLRKAARALDFRGQHAEAATVRQLLEIATYEKARGMRNALYAPESPATPQFEQPPIVRAGTPRTRQHGRIAIGSTPSDKADFPTY